MSSLSLLAVVIMIEAPPVMTYLRVERYGGQLGVVIPELLIAGVSIVAICAATTILPLRLALRRIELMEW
jgi:hypothetical protein